jgi:NADPH-dependent 2,4-dienoyl-CoA reductase/sulfur reductase-like enzyme/rhodanese-related sulfurtransferase
METVVIIGGVAAGATTAAKIRRLCSDTKIIMLEAGEDISFANCGLPYFIGGDIDSRSKLILQSPQSFNEQYNVDVHINTKVIKIDKNSKVITAINTKTRLEENYEYTKLVLAQGGRPIIPNIDGANLDNVFALWTLEDMDNIEDYIKENNPQTAVVVGAGFIGLEMVEALSKRGISVSIVEKQDYVMPIMEAEISGFIQEELLSYGIDIYTNVALSKINDDNVLLEDGSIVDSDMVILSVGVRPTLDLAKDTGLEIGEMGGLLVDSTLKTSDDSIYGAGDMIEIEHRISNRKVRIPLAGPANRQGRIVAENIFGANREYKGSLGTSIVRVFESVAGITGLSLQSAIDMGFDADAIVVHKEQFTSYMPNSTNVSIFLVYDKKSGVILGGQTAGYDGADKRLDIIATAISAKMTLDDLADTDFAYSPPIGTANDAINMAIYTAQNKISKYSLSVNTLQIDSYISDKNPFIIDVRDSFAFDKGHIQGAINIPLEFIVEKLSSIPKDRAVLVYDQNGKKGHQALRTLIGAGINEVVNISGGYISLLRYTRSLDFTNFSVSTPDIQPKSLNERNIEQEEEQEVVSSNDTSLPIIIDVRTKGEFDLGAYPDAVNIPLDEIQECLDEVGDKNRDITVYCASGARSSYAQQILIEQGYTDVKNGGGLMQMMASL